MHRPMKRFTLPTILALSLAGGLAVAQQAVEARHHHSHDPHKAAIHMSKKLNLSADQTAKVEPILAAREQKIAALKSNTAVDEKGRKEQMRAIHSDTEQQLSGILSANQMTQLKSMRHGHGKKHTGPLTPQPTA